MPPPPPGGESTKYYVVVVVLLAAGLIGLLVWNNSRGKTPPPQVVYVPAPSTSGAATTTAPPAIEDEVPPPPDLPEAGPEGGAPSNGGHGGISTANSGPAPGLCDGSCNGQASPDLQVALAFRAKQAHRCYDTALAQDSTLQGHVKIGVRVASNGQVCSANVSSNDLANPGVANCIANMFRQAGHFPPPKGGCVDANVPIALLPQGGK
jgi:hypothetical protein